MTFRCCFCDQVKKVVEFRPKQWQFEESDGLRVEFTDAFDFICKRCLDGSYPALK